MNTETENAYLAGIIDGEGCIRLIASNGYGPRTPKLYIAQKNYWFLTMLQAKYSGGHLCRTSSAWQLQWQKASAVKDVLTKVLPYLVIKRDLAEMAILLCDYVSKDSRHYDDRKKLERLKFEQVFDQKIEELRTSALVAPENLKLRASKEQD